MKYRKKPVVIDAEDWNGSAYGADFILAWIAQHGQKAEHIQEPNGHKNAIAITTLEGTMHAMPGDWIIKGVKGEFYPCKPDIFAATYEKAE